MQTVEIQFPDDYTPEQIEDALRPKPDTSIADGIKALTEALGGDLNVGLESIEVTGIPETKLDGLAKSLKAIESAIKAIKTPELPDNSELSKSMVLVAKAIAEIRMPEVTIPETKQAKSAKIIRKRHVIDGQEVFLLDGIEYVY